MTDFFGFPVLLKKFPSFTIISIFIGLLITIRLFGEIAERILNKATKDIDENPPKKFREEHKYLGCNDLRKEWKKAVEQPKSGGIYLGRLERTLAYFAFLFGFPEALGIWLVFKVASKFEVWRNITIVKGIIRNKKSDTPDEFDFEARRLWGSRVLQRFLIGTLWNMLSGFFGVVLTYILIKVLIVSCP